MSAVAPEIEAVLQQVDQAAKQGKLLSSAAENIRTWLTQPGYRDFAENTLRHIQEQKWTPLNDVFWTALEFGTGGRRGKMYPIGCNAINDRTIGESAQGLADYVLSQRKPGDPAPSCAIAYDTRHRSRHFAELCAEVLLAAGFKIFFLDGYRSTPALSVAVRHKHATCGIMVTASHNPPSDNAVKVYWSSGGQLVPPDDRGVIERVKKVQEIRRTPFSKAVSEGKVEFCQDEVDAVYMVGLRSQSIPGPRNVRILYSPMHGVGAHAVCPLLAAEGFREVEVFGPHAEHNGDFPNVPKHIANPENPETFTAMIAQAQVSGQELILSTDPDADRLGAAAQVKTGGHWATLSGNSLAALLTHFLLQSKRQAGTLTDKHFVVTTLVTTGMIRRIAQDFGVRFFGDLLVGFKWIADKIDEVGAEHFVCGSEESHGFQAGTYARDKDGAVAALLLAELAAVCKERRETLHQHLDKLYLRYGCHLERQISIELPGAEGMKEMQKVMARLRKDPLRTVAGLAVAQRRDYGQQQITLASGATKPLAGPKGDLVFLDLAADGNYLAVRPSGTEPKLKIYMFGYELPPAAGELGDAKQRLLTRLEQMAADMREYAKQ